MTVPSLSAMVMAYVALLYGHRKGSYKEVYGRKQSYISAEHACGCGYQLTVKVMIRQGVPSAVNNTDISTGSLNIPGAIMIKIISLTFSVRTKAMHIYDQYFYPGSSVDLPTILPELA